MHLDLEEIDIACTFFLQFIDEFRAACSEITLTLQKKHESHANESSISGKNLYELLLATAEIYDGRLKKMYDDLASQKVSQRSLRGQGCRDSQSNQNELDSSGCCFNCVF